MATISIRQQIKNQIKNYLTGLTINNKVANVFFNDPYSLDKNDLPAICIQTLSDTSTDKTIGYPASVHHTLTLEISLIYQATYNLDETIEEFATIVESKLSESEEIKKLGSINGVVTSIDWESTEYRDFSEIETKVAGAVLSYNIFYIAIENELRQDI